MKSLDWKYILRTYLMFFSRRKLLVSMLLFSAFVVAALPILAGYITKRIIDSLENITSFTNELYILLSLFGLVSILLGVGWYVKIWLINQVDSHSMTDLKNVIFKHVIYLSQKFHSSNKTGS